MGTKQDKVDRTVTLTLFTIVFIIATLDFSYSQKVIKAKWIALIFTFTFSFLCFYKAVTVLAESRKIFMLCLL